MENILIGIVSGILTTAIIGISAFLIQPIRDLLRFRSHEYYLWNSSNDTRCTWDIQWEGERLTIDAQAVHNDHLDSVVLKRNNANEHSVGKWEVTDEFQAPERWPIQVKLDAIVRRKTGNERIYNVHFIVRRKRW